jgi:hypothetical protein
MKNALPVEYDDRALKSKDSMIGIHRCHHPPSMVNAVRLPLLMGLVH